MTSTNKNIDKSSLFINIYWRFDSFEAKKLYKKIKKLVKLNTIKQFIVETTKQQTLSLLYPLFKYLAQRNITIVYRTISQADSEIINCENFVEFVQTSWNQIKEYTRDNYMKNWSYDDLPYYGIAHPDEYVYYEDDGIDDFVLQLHKKDTIKPSNMKGKAILNGLTNEELVNLTLISQKYPFIFADSSFSLRNNIKAVSFCRTNFNNENLKTLLSMKEFIHQIVYIDLQSTCITDESIEDMVNLIKMDNIKFVNIWGTDFAYDFIEEDNLKQLSKYCDDDPSIFSKLIWYAVEEGCLKENTQQFAEEYTTAIIGSHDRYDKLQNWLDYLLMIEKAEETVASALI